MKPIRSLLIFFMTIYLVLALALPSTAAALGQQADDPTPPNQPVKLVFIHHSTGGNWLADPSGNDLGGGLGGVLMENNYYVSATNYSWGPDSIGDATDIPNWPDWFSGPNSATYLNALYNEDGQNFGDFGAWPRLPADPGGENQIILFKSCFPNSDLEGQPDDPPDPEGWLSVGHAKYVYNEILGYFATRPDKLFIVITAPPLTPGSTSAAHAANARAFNNWLVNDWLAENNYTLANVAVFDFYNVLTGPDNHHRFLNGEVQHVYQEGQNTEYYPSGDDHPSRPGNQKATEEFVPLLNIFYHRWAQAGQSQPAGATQPTPTETETQVQPAASETAQPVPGQISGLIANFDDLTPSLATYWDEATNTQISCAPSEDAAYDGTSSLKIDLAVAAGSWSTCVLSFDSPQDWSSGQGVWFALHASQTGIPYNIILYAGSPDNQETYLDSAVTPTDSTGGWATIEIPWADFKRADWEVDGGTTFNKPGQITGMAFGFDGLESAVNTGTVWVDSISYRGAPAQTGELPTSSPQPEPDGHGGGLPCLGSALLPLALAGAAWFLRRR